MVVVWIVDVDNGMIDDAIDVLARRRCLKLDGGAGVKDNKDDVSLQQ